MPDKEKTRMTVKEWAANEGYTSDAQFQQRLREIVFDSVAPAMCIHGCEVEPDGKCEHGNPSILLAMGMI